MTTVRRTLRTPEDLAAAALIPEAMIEDIRRVATRYAIAVSPAVRSLIDTTRRDDPIARQFVPDPRELHHRAAEVADPIGDAAKSPVKGIVHRYPDRVLLKVVSVCPVYCRFCFRREMVGPEASGNLTRDEISAALAYVASRPEIWEVIVTGGDPLMLSAPRLGELTAAIETIPHVRVLRWHTRVPAVAPERVSADVAASLKGVRLPSYVAIHANHPRELTGDVRAACGRLARSGCILVSQSVLLKGVNDDVATLEALMRGFVEAGVKPYYLHHADLAPGTSHFRVPLATGRKLVAELRARVSGIAMPAYVLDIPGAYGKVPISKDHVVSGDAGAGTSRIRDSRGTLHGYADPDCRD